MGCIQPNCCGDEPCPAYIPSDLWGANRKENEMEWVELREEPPLHEPATREEELSLLTRQDLEELVLELERRLDAIVELES